MSAPARKLCRNIDYQIATTVCFCARIRAARNGRRSSAEGRVPVDSQYYQAEQVAAEGPAEMVAPVAEATLEREDPQGSGENGAVSAPGRCRTMAEGRLRQSRRPPAQLANRATLLAQALLDATADI